MAVRLAGVGVLPHTDHRITFELVRRFGFVALVTEIPRVQPHFPLYYLLLEVWALAFSLESAQVLSLAAGTVTPVVVSGRETVASAAQSATGTVEVSAAGYDASLHGSVGGRVEIGVEGSGE